MTVCMRNADFIPQELGIYRRLCALDGMEVVLQFPFRLSLVSYLAVHKQGKSLDGDIR